VDPVVHAVTFITALALTGLSLVMVRRVAWPGDAVPVRGGAG
jgi:hypothetical protein